MRAVVAAILLGAALAWAQPARVGCGPGQAGCGPAAVLGVTTTTLPGAAAPSWVPSMLAAWMLDETSGTRVNLQGTTSRDLNNVDGADPGSSTDHQEGTRSMSVVAAQARHTTDTFASLVSPVTMGCWAKMAANPSNDAAVIMHYYVTSAGTTRIDRTPTGAYKFTVYDSIGTAYPVTSAVVANGAWHHVAGVMVANASVTLYVDGVLAATVPMTTPAIATANPLFLADNFVFTGLIDECWIGNVAPSAASICRICSCGIRGEQCTCAGTAFASTGRNATACGSCTLPADCSVTTPP